MSNRLIADYEIRQLHARFVDAAWRKDSNLFSQCFAQHGEWKIAGMHIRGRTDIGIQIARLLASCERVLLTYNNPVLEIGESSATGRVYVTEYAKLRDGSAARTIGIYYDHYVTEADRWVFQSRHWNLAYRGPADLSAPFVDCADYGPHPGMPPADDTPTSKTS